MRHVIIFLFNQVKNTLKNYRSFVTLTAIMLQVLELVNGGFNVLKVAVLILLTKNWKRDVSKGRTTNNIMRRQYTNTAN